MSLSMSLCIYMSLYVCIYVCIYVSMYIYLWSLEGHKKPFTPIHYHYSKEQEQTYKSGYNTTLFPGGPPPQY